MTSLSYLLTHHLCGAINSYQYAAEDGSLSHWILHPSVAFWWHRLVLELSRHLRGSKSSKCIWFKSTSSAHDHTHGWEGVMSLVHCQHLGYVSCSSWVDRSQHSSRGLEWRVIGGSSVSPRPLTHTSTHVRTHLQSIMLVCPSQQGRSPCNSR